MPSVKLLGDELKADSQNVRRTNAFGATIVSGKCPNIVAEGLLFESQSLVMCFLEVGDVHPRNSTPYFARNLMAFQ